MRTVVVFLLLVAAARNSHAPQAGETRLARHTAIARRWIDEGFNRRNVNVISELFADAVVVNGQRVGRPGLTQGMNQRFAAFPDLHVDLTATVAEGDHVAIWYTARGTQRGDFGAVRATGRSATWIGSDLLRFEGDTIVEARFLDDSLGLMRQLGALPDR